MTDNAKHMDTSDKPERLDFKTYLQLVKNSVGSAMFRNYYVRSERDGEFDALGDGSDSCAFYVSAVLAIFKKIGSAHGTIASTVKDLEAFGWQVVEDAKPGDVIVWEAIDFPDGRSEHIGFCVAFDKAVSTSQKKKVVVEHDIRFGASQRAIKQIFRNEDWAGRRV